MYCSQLELSARRGVQKVLESLYKLLSGCKGIIIARIEKYLIVGNPHGKFCVNRWKMCFERQAYSCNESPKSNTHESFNALKFADKQRKNKASISYSANLGEGCTNFSRSLHKLQLKFVQPSAEC